MTPLQQAAARYARAGFPVIAVWGLRGKVCRCPKGAKCPTPGKHPVDNNWPARATADPQRAAARFAGLKHAHIGILPPAGHVIVDVDPRNGGKETLNQLLNGHKMPNTPIQRSGGGGIHIVLAGDIPAPLGKGIDVKRPGRGYVVAEPAEHVSGGKYVWRSAPWNVHAAPVPTTWAAKKLTVQHEEVEHIPTTVPLQRVKEALAHVDADDYARWVNIGQALKYNYGDDGHAVWVDWSKTSSKYESGDEDKWDTFDRNRDRALITVRSIMAMARRSGYRPLAKEFERSLWALGDISDLLGSEAEPVDWVLEPCIPAGKVTLLAGAGGSSKSYLAMTLAMQLAVEQEFGPFKPARPGKALLLVAEENKQDVHRRLRAILKARMYSDEQVEQIAQRIGVVSVRGHDWRLVYHDEAGDVQETERVDYLIDELCSLRDVRLLVLDPLVAFNGANENDNMEMARLMFALDRIAERTGAAVVVLHHVSKGGQITTLQDATQAVVRGASALVDNARAAILLTRMPRADAPLYNITAEQAGRFVVARVVKNNYGPHTPDVVFAVEAGGALRLAPEVQRVHRTPAAAQRAMEQQTTPLAVLRALHAQPGAAQGALAQAAGIAQQRVSQVLQQLMEEGHVRRLGVGRNTTYEITPAGHAALRAAGTPPAQPENNSNDDIF